MTKEQFIKELEHIAESGSNEIRLGNLFDLVIAQDRESRWISVKDRLPEVPEGDDFVRVLLYANGHVLFGKYGQIEDEGGYDFIEVDASQGSMDYCGHATHWQPLPEPLKQLTP